MHTHKHIYKHVYKHMYKHTYKHIHAHMHTYKHINAAIRKNGREGLVFLTVATSWPNWIVFLVLDHLMPHRKS